MASEKHPPASLHPKVAKALLDRLGDADDTAFRELFARDPHAALAEVGYVSAGECLQLSGATLASAEDIRRDRQKLEESLTAPFSFTFSCPQALKA
jgi:putative modified peptide